MYSFAVEIIFPKFAYSFDLFANCLGSIFPEESSFSKLFYLDTISLTFCRGNINQFFSFNLFSTSCTILSIIFELGTFVCGTPDKYSKLLSCPPPVNPISV